MPAVPSFAGVADVFAMQQSGNVQAIKSDGTLAWTQNVSTATSLTPDFQGGLVVANMNASPATVQKLDGMTGTANQLYTYASPNNPPVLVHTNSTIFTVDNNAIVGVNPATGQPGFAPVPLEMGVGSGNGNCGEYPPFQNSNPATVGQPIIAGDGYAYFPYVYTMRPLSSNQAICPSGGSTIHSETHSRVMRVRTDGAADEIVVQDWSLDGTNVPFVASSLTGSQPGNVLGTLITNADQGVLYSWAECPFTNSITCTPQFHITTITNGTPSTVTTNLGYQPGTSYQGIVPLQPILQRADGSYIGTVGTSTGNSMIAFTSTGRLVWPGQNDTPQIATSDGGVIGTSGITYDQNGNADGQLANLPTQSFIGNDYKLGSINQVLDTPYNYTTSYAATAGGNPGPPQVYVPSLGAIYRAQIASDAKGYVGNSTNWNEKTNGGTVTCNLFVQSVLTQASNECKLNIPAPTRPHLSWWQSNWRHPFLAADWANPNVNGGCWKPLPSGPGGALPGDVIATGYPANGPDTTGHVGIVVEPNSGYPNYIVASSANVAPYWWTPQQKQSFIAGTITLTDYGFRAPGFDFTNPLDNQGLEQDSYVRRFSCY